MDKLVAVVAVVAAAGDRLVAILVGVAGRDDLNRPQVGPEVVLGHRHQQRRVGAQARQRNLDRAARRQCAAANLGALGETDQRVVLIDLHDKRRVIDTHGVGVADDQILRHAGPQLHVRVAQPVEFLGGDGEIGPAVARRQIHLAVVVDVAQAIGRVGRAVFGDVVGIQRVHPTPEQPVVDARIADARGCEDAGRAAQRVAQPRLGEGHGGVFLVALAEVGFVVEPAGLAVDRKHDRQPLAVDQRVDRRLVVVGLAPRQERAVVAVGQQKRAGVDRRRERSGRAVPGKTVFAQQFRGEVDFGKPQRAREPTGEPTVGAGVPVQRLNVGLRVINALRRVAQLCRVVGEELVRLFHGQAETPVGVVVVVVGVLKIRRVGRPREKRRVGRRRALVGHQTRGQRIGLRRGIDRQPPHRKVGQQVVAVDGRVVQVATGVAGRAVTAVRVRRHVMRRDQFRVAQQQHPRRTRAPGLVRRLQESGDLVRGAADLRGRANLGVEPGADLPIAQRLRGRQQARVGDDDHLGPGRAGRGGGSGGLVGQRRIVDQRRGPGVFKR